MRRRDRQRGAATVEFALTIPAVLMVIAGTIYIGRALHARGRLVDAVGFATRSEAIASSTRPGGTVDSGAIISMINGKMVNDTDCILPVTVTWQVSGTAPYRHLDVTASCPLQTPILGAFLGTISLNDVSASASMPLDYESPN